MSPDDHKPAGQRPPEDDLLLQRYREANAHDPARPAPALREAVLAQAREALTLGTQGAASLNPATAKRPAANDGTWKLRAFGSLAVIGLVGLLALQFDRGTPEERELAFGVPDARPVPAAPPAAESTSDAAVAPAPIPAAEPGTEPLPDPTAPAEAMAAAAPARAANGTGPKDAAPAPDNARESLSKPARPEPLASGSLQNKAAPGPADATRPESPTPLGRAAPEASIAQAPRAFPANPSRVLPPAAPAEPAAAPPTSRPEREQELADFAPAPPAAPSRMPPPLATESATRSAAAAGAPMLRGSMDAPGAAADLQTAPRVTSPAGAAKARAATSTADLALLRHAGQGNLADAQAALADGANPNATDASGQTALMLAAQRGQVDMLRLLLDAGARTAPVNRRGLTAAQMALNAGHAEAARLLDSAAEPPR